MELISKLRKRLVVEISHVGVQTLVCLSIQQDTQAEACTPSLRNQLNRSNFEIASMSLKFQDFIDIENDTK